MTPKEKAKELVDKMTFETHLYNAKHCALTAVDEILEILDFDLGHDDTARGLCKYWQEVKKEIEKL